MGPFELRWCVMARVKDGLNGVAKRSQNPALNLCLATSECS
ncbi:hypothetical protein [Selenomonas sp. KH1T6]